MMKEVAEAMKMLEQWGIWCIQMDI